MWQSRPVFISSTFADMQAERDYLRTRVFPELEERLRTLRHYLGWIDLRFGIATGSQADEEEREALILKTCLAEVERCRPFLIVLLGDRYGWVPPADLLKMAEIRLDAVGRSVTDLEIDFGVLSDPQQRRRSRFYFREPLPYTKMPPQTAALYSDAYATDSVGAERRQRLAALKRRIEGNLPGQVRRYAASWDGERQRVSNLEEFGRMVLEDIWAELAAEIGPPKPESTWQEVERDALEDFIDDRARDFVGRTAIIERLSKLCISPTKEGAAWGACVTGEAGAGKSALLGALYRRLGGGNVFLLAHAAGASAAAVSVDSMLRRWIGELAAALKIADVGLAENADAETIEATFSRLLYLMASERRVVVLVDALDQFETTTRGQFATWLPRLWPVSARFVATAIPGSASKALAERSGMEMLSLPPLDGAEARGIIDGVCNRYHRTFEDEVITALLAKAGTLGPAWENPLWLVIAVEELNLLDADDFVRVERDYTGPLAERLRGLMVDEVIDFPGDIPGLYDHSFVRAEKLFGESLTRAFIGLIAVSRAGWREIDFRMLLPRASGKSWDELQFAQLRRIFRGQMRRRGALAQWNFNHAQMRAAAHQRLAVMHLSEPRLHAITADHLLTLAHDDPLRVSESMFHLLGSENWARAAGHYGSSTLTEAEVRGATLGLAEGIIALSNDEPEIAKQKLHRLLETPGVEDSVKAMVASRLLVDLHDTIEHNVAIDLRQAVVELAKGAFEQLVHAFPDHRGWQIDLSLSYERFGNLLFTQSKLSEASSAYRACLSIREQLAAADPVDSRLQDGVSVSYEKIGNVLLARGDLTGAMANYQKTLAIREHLCDSEPTNAEWLRDIAVTHNKVAQVLVAQGQLAEATASYQAAHRIAQLMARANPANSELATDLSVSYQRIGDVLVAQGKLTEAMAAYNASHAIIERLAATDPGNTTWQRNLTLTNSRIGSVLVQQGNLKEATTAYRAARSTTQRLVRLDPANVDWQRDLSVTDAQIGDVLAACGDLNGAMSAYRASLSIVEQMAQGYPDDAASRRDLSVLRARIANILLQQGNYTEALAAYRTFLASAEQLAVSDTTNANWQRDLFAAHNRIGDILLAQRKISEAMVAYHASHGIVERLARADPSNAKLQSDFAVSQTKLGNVLMVQGKLTEALATYRAAAAIAERLTKSDPSNNGWRRDLSMAYDRVADASVALRRLSEALPVYLDCLAIRESLVEADPSNVVWQRDLSVAYQKIGQVLASQGKRSETIAAYRTCIVIRERVLAADPDNPVFGRDLSETQEHLGDALTEQGAGNEAIAAYQACVAIRESLASNNPDNSGLRRELADGYEKLGDALLAQGRTNEALATFRANLTILEHLATGEPADIDLQRELANAHGRIGKALAAHRFA